GQAVLGAGGLAFVLRERVRFDILHHVAFFICWCGLLVPALLAVPQAAMLGAAGVQGGGFWQVWQGSALASSALVLAIVPPCLNRPGGAFQRILAGTVRRQLEAALLVLP